jgi:hypothetical protein
MELVSVLTCPVCAHVERLTMPTDACMYFHECAVGEKHTWAALRVNSGDGIP